MGGALPKLLRERFFMPRNRDALERPTDKR